MPFYCLYSPLNHNFLFSYLATILKMLFYTNSVQRSYYFLVIGYWSVTVVIILMKNSTCWVLQFCEQWLVPILSETWILSTIFDVSYSYDNTQSLYFHQIPATLVVIALFISNVINYLESSLRIHLLSTLSIKNFVTSLLKDKKNCHLP